MKNLKGDINNNLSRQHEKTEFSKGKTGIMICEICDSVYFKKSWHNSIANLKISKEDTPLNFTICPACKMIKNNQFEGEIKIINIPEKFKIDLLNLIKNSGDQAREIDPLDRVIKIEKINLNEIRVITTENQLANKIAKKIKTTFKPKEIKISESPSPNETVRIKISF